MKHYISSKLTKAKPLSRGEYNLLRDWTIPDNEGFSDEGYLVEYLDSPTTGMPEGFTNYISWSPKDVFERANQSTEGMSFGMAIEAAKKGLKISRVGWNGTGMFVYYVPANSYPASRNNLETVDGLFPDDMVPYREYLALKTAQNDVATWSPSTSDALATDWMIV